MAPVDLDKAVRPQPISHGQVSSGRQGSVILAEHDSLGNVHVLEFRCVQRRSEKGERLRHQAADQLVLLVYFAPPSATARFFDGFCR
jgi:hypothetical protein